MKERIVSFDALRFILALCVLFGHTFITLFRVDKTDIMCIKNLAVDGFFIISGFLMALSYNKYENSLENPATLFIQSIWHRIKRLAPEYLFALLLFIVILGFVRHYSVLNVLLNVMFISEINKIPGIVIGSWYVSVLFWGGCIYLMLLFYLKRTAVYFFIPLVVFISFSYTYATYTSLSLNAMPLFAGIFSAGFLKGFMGMGIGILCFFICQKMQKNSFQIRWPKAFYLILEIASVVTLVYCLNLKELTKNEYLVYFAYPTIIGLLYCRKETFLKFLSWKIWRPLAPTAYMLYLTHYLWLEIIKRYIPYKNYSEVVVYASVMIFCVIFAYICYHAQKWLFTRLKQMLFVPQDNLLEQHIENTMENSVGGNKTAELDKAEILQ